MPQIPQALSKIMGSYFLRRTAVSKEPKMQRIAGTEDRKCKPQAKGQKEQGRQKRQSFQHSPQAYRHEHEPTKSCHNAD